VRLRGFPFVIFVDAKALFLDELKMKKAEEKLPSYDLDNVLHLLIGKQKLEHNYVEMNIVLQNACSDVSNIIAYCCFDAHALLLVEEKFNIINSKLTMASMLNVPLTTLFANKQAVSLTCAEFAEFF
jgi:hypothetical protein